MSAERGKIDGVVCPVEAPAPRSEVQALAEEFPLDAKLLYAPRALLEVVAGGQPRKSAHGTHFFQVTPLCVIAAGKAFQKMHEDYFGDEYCYPAPYGAFRFDENSYMQPDGAHKAMAAASSGIVPEDMRACVERNALLDALSL